MARSNVVRTLSTLSFGLTLIAGISSCDDVPEEPKQKPSELSKKNMLDKLRQNKKVELSLPLLSFDMQHNGESITLVDGDREKILQITDSLCNIGRQGGKSSNLFLISILSSSFLAK